MEELGKQTTTKFSCSFRTWIWLLGIQLALPFLGHLENVWALFDLLSISIKKKVNRNPGSNPDLEPGPFVYQSLSPAPTLPQQPARIPKHLSA